MGGKTVKIFLVDGSPSGLITAEVINYSIKVFVASRSQLIVLSKREEIKSSGVYFLVGSAIKDPTQNVVYIGESENVLTRLLQHSKASDKDFWERTIVITSSGGNLTKGHIRFLESALIKLATEAKKAMIDNGTHPGVITLPESDTSDMCDFIELIKLVLPVLGFTFLSVTPTLSELSSSHKPSDLSPMFILQYSGAQAQAQETAGSFIVLQGSLARKATTPSLAQAYINIRKNLISLGVLNDSLDPKYYEFTENYSFNSPSTAANIIGGASLNGRQRWKVKDTGQTYGKWSEEKFII